MKRPIILLLANGLLGACHASQVTPSLVAPFDEDGKTVEIKINYPPFPWQNE